MNYLESKTLDNLIKNELEMQTQRFEQKKQEIINNSLKELKLKTNFIQYLLKIIYQSNDNKLHTKVYLYGKEYLKKLKKLKEE